MAVIDTEFQEKAVHLPDGLDWFDILEYKFLMIFLIPISILGQFINCHLTVVSFSFIIDSFCAHNSLLHVSVDSNSEC